MHAYTILDYLELKKDGKKYQELIKMRNPWGNEKYVGPWNDKDPRWTQDLIVQSDYKDMNDGHFYMPYSEFKIAFPYFYIALY